MPSIQQYLNAIINIGINSSMSYLQKKRILTINLIAISCIPFMTYFAIINISQERYILASINISNNITSIITLIFLYYHKHSLAKATLLIPSFIGFSLGALLFHNSGQYYLISILIISLLIYDDYRIHILSTTLIISSLITIEIFAPLLPLHEPIPKSRVIFNTLGSISFILVAIQFYIQILQKKMNMLNEQRLRLHSANQDKEKMFSIIVHDIKSPFAILESLANALNEKMVSNEDSQEFTQQICEKIATQNKILNDLLKWGSANIQGAAKAATSIFVPQFIENITKIYEEQIEQKQLQLNINIPAHTLLFANTDHLTVIVRNLLNNAIKFSYTKGQINIFTTQDQNQTYIHIQDNGIGINQIKLSLLFNEIQNSSTGTQNEKGSGLGLILCRDLIKQNNGSISIESSPYKGSTFTIGLPTKENNNETYEMSKTSEKLSLFELKKENFA